MSLQIEYVLANDSWDHRERERQQVLRDRLRSSLRSRNPRQMTPIDETVEDVADALAR